MSGLYSGLMLAAQITLLHFFSLCGDELAEIGGRAHKHCTPEFSELCLSLGIGEARVDLLVERVDNLDRCVLGSADPKHRASLGEPLTDQACENVRRTAGRRADDDAHLARRIVLAPMRSAIVPAARPRPWRDADIVGGDVSWPPSHMRLLERAATPV